LIACPLVVVAALLDLLLGSAAVTGGGCGGFARCGSSVLGQLVLVGCQT